MAKEGLFSKIRGLFSKNNEEDPAFRRKMAEKLDGRCIIKIIRKENAYFFVFLQRVCMVFNMANVISDDTIEYVGILAKLELDKEEKEQAKKDMESMLDYIDKLNELDTEDVVPMSHTFSVHNVFREDIVTNGDDRENMLFNAPEQKDGAYQVPKTVE